MIAKQGGEFDSQAGRRVRIEHLPREFAGEFGPIHVQQAAMVLFHQRLNGTCREQNAVGGPGREVRDCRGREPRRAQEQGTVGGKFGIEERFANRIAGVRPASLAAPEQRFRSGMTNFHRAVAEELAECRDQFEGTDRSECIGRSGANGGLLGDPTDLEHEFRFTR